MNGRNGDSLGKKLSNAEKRWFPWRKNRIVKGQPVFFPGCNLVNFLPHTARKTIEIVEACGGGWLYDCCGKPLSYSRDHIGVSAISDRINRKLQEAEVPEIITACPNCLDQFRKTSPIPVKDIYTFLREKDIPCESRGEKIVLFQPCPDRGSGEIVQSIALWTGMEVEPQKGLPCCGLAIQNPEKARAAVERIRTCEKKLSTCCASCAGNLSRNGVALKPHMLTEGLGLEEGAAEGPRIALNRFRPMHWK